MTNFLAWIRSHFWLAVVSAIVVTVVGLLIVSQWPPTNATQTAIWLALGAAIVIFAALIYSAIEPPSSGDAPMPRGKRIFLLTYLLVCGAGLMLMLTALASMDFPDTPLRPQETAATPTSTPTTTPTATPTPPQTQLAAGTQVQPPVAPRTQPAPAPTPAAPTLVRVFSESSGEPPTQYLTVYGRNFKKDKSQIRFNGKKAATEFFADTLLKRPLSAEDLVGRSAVMVEVVNQNDDGGETVSNAILVPIEKPRETLYIFFLRRFWEPALTREMQLLLMVIFAGALGSYLHALMSIADFIGNRELKISWFWWYLTRPFLGMALGLIFYAVLRGGFLVGTPADEKFVNPFGVIAIGALVGMFADKASQKLGEIFDVVFKSTSPERGDPLTGSAVISSLEPTAVSAGADVEVKILGDNLATVKKVKVNDAERDITSATKNQVLFTLKAADIAGQSTIKLTVLNSKGDALGSTNLPVTGSEEEQTGDGDALISALDPATVPAGSPDTPVKIIGEHLATTAKVKVNDVERAVTSATETEVVFTLAAAEIVTPSTPTITLLDNTGEVLVVTTDFVVAAQEDAG